MGKGFRLTIKSLNSEVSGSSIMFKIKRPGEPFERIIGDMGGFQELSYEYLNHVLDFDPSELSYMFVTHNHYDHVARIPYLVKNGFHREIYCTPASKISIPIGLKDILKIMTLNNKYFKIKMLYGHDEVAETESLLKSIEYNLPTHVSKGVKLTFLGNGHLYGAACVLLQVSCPKYKDKNILITGDYYPTNDLFKVPEIPEWVKELEDLTIIQESTYGDVSINSIEKKLDNYIINALKSNKNIVMPVISQERLELVLLTLKKLQEKKLLSTSVKIFIHTELGKEYLNKVYLDSNDIIDFMPKNTKLIARDDFKTALAYKGLKIILSSSGMADKGCVRYYLRNVLPREDYTVIFTCYTPKGSLGYKLRTATKGEFIRIDNQFVNLLCDVKHSGELSKHVKFEGIVYFINQFKHVKNILLTHGETKTKALLYNKLKNVYPDKNIFIMNRETGFKLDQNMDITTYPTNFKNDTEFIRKYSNQKKHSNAKNNKCNKHHYNKTIKKKYFNKK